MVSNCPWPSLVWLSLRRRSPSSQICLILTLIYIFGWPHTSPSIDGNSLSEKNARIEMKCLSPHMIQDNRDKTLTLPAVTRSTSQQTILTMRLLVILLTTLLSLSVRGEEDVQAHSAVIESCGGWRLNKVSPSLSLQVLTDNHPAQRCQELHLWGISNWLSEDKF